MQICMPEERVPFQKITVIAGWEPPCGFWKLNSGPLAKQAVLLSTETALMS